jgi:bifunctional enzyme CysN/CysC
MAGADLASFFRSQGRPKLRMITFGSAEEGASSLIGRLLDESLLLAGEQVLPLADVALVLIDATSGVVSATRRHSLIVSLFKIPRVIVAVSKMDRVGYSREVFGRVEREYRECAARIGVTDLVCVPICAIDGQNVVVRSPAMPWYEGPTILEHLDSGSVDHSDSERPFRLPVQSVNRGSSRAACAGVIVSGRVSAGDLVRILPSGRDITVSRVQLGGAEVPEARAREAVTVTVSDEVEIGRGDVLAAPVAPAPVADQFEATIVWMHQDPLLQGRTYVLELATQTVSATVMPIKHKINVDTLEHVAAEKLDLNDIGVCELELSHPIVFEPFNVNRGLGGFTLIDRENDIIVGAGVLHFALRRAQNVRWQALDIDKSARAGLKGQTPCVVWLTGLSGAGKSTIANLVEKKLHALARHTYILDGDNVRHGLNKDLGFTETDRVENIRRVAEVSRLMVDAGLIVLVSFISPFRAERRVARELFEAGEFFEVFVDAPLAVAETRDPKGLYKKARRGELKNFTGVDSPYEEPENPDIRIDTTRLTVEDAAEAILERLRRAGIITAGS